MIAAYSDQERRRASGFIQPTGPEERTERGQDRGGPSAPDDHLSSAHREERLHSGNHETIGCLGSPLTGPQGSRSQLGLGAEIECYGAHNGADRRVVRETEAAIKDGEKNDVSESLRFAIIEGRLRMEINKACRQYNIDEDKENLADIVKPYISERLSQRNWSGEFGGNKDSMIEVIFKKWVDFLDGPDSINQDAFKELNRIINRRELKKYQIPQDMDSVPVENETKEKEKLIDAAIDSKRSPAMDVDKIVIWITELGELNRREGSFWAYLRGLKSDYWLRRLLRVMVIEDLEDRLEALAKWAVEMSGKDVTFPVMKKYEDALIDEIIDKIKLESRSFPQVSDLFWRHYGVEIKSDALKKRWKRKPRRTEKPVIKRTILDRIYRFKEKYYFFKSKK